MRNRSLQMLLAGWGVVVVFATMSAAASSPPTDLSPPVRLQAEHADTKTVGGMDGPGWNLWSAGRFETGFLTEDSGEYLVTVRAHGHSNTSIEPLMVVEVDGIVIGRQSVAAGDGHRYRSYEMTASLAAGRHRLSVAFVNDPNTPVADVDLVVDWVEIARTGGTEPPVTEPPTTSPATTSVPTTSIPTTSIPATSTPTTSTPTTLVPTTSVPPTTAPPTEPSITQPPTTKPPVTGAPTTASPPSTAPPGAARSFGGGDIAGLFYGNPFSGDHTGNSNQFRHSAARRFLAQQTGTVSAVTYNNRVMSQANIDDRASGNNVWAQCKNGGLDKYTCGYILSNAYSLGNGGRLKLELRTDDGTAAHNPSETVLATTEEFVPMDNEGTNFPVLELDRPVELRAGEIYHLVFLQLNPTSCGRKLSVAEARGCDRDKGVIGLNGTYYDAQMPTGPFGGTTDANLLRNSPSDPWKQDRGELAFYGLRYDDDRWYGHLMTYYNGYKFGEAGGNHYVGGSDQARQVFTVNDRSYQVDGLWVRVDRPRSTGGTLRVEVRRNGATLASGSINAAQTVSNCDDRCSGDWVYTELDRSVSLQQGQSYETVFSADGGSRFSLQSGFPMDYNPYRVGESGSWWDDAWAEFSSNNGANWRPYSVRGGSANYPKRDLSLVFTLVGGPREVP